MTLRQLATVYEQEGNFSESETLYRRALAIQLLLKGPSRQKMSETLQALSNLLRKTGRAAESSALDREAVILMNQTP